MVSLSADESMENERHHKVALSPAETVLAFQSEKPLIRVPVLCGKADAAEGGDFLLAFPRPREWLASWMKQEKRISTQCEAEARFGCSVRASKSCQNNWLQRLIGKVASSDEEIERCEALEMSGCLSESTERCKEMAKEKCTEVYRDMKIARKLNLIDPAFLEDPYSSARELVANPFSNVVHTEGLNISREIEFNAKEVKTDFASSSETLSNSKGGYEGGIIHPKKDSKYRIKFDNEGNS